MGKLIQNPDGTHVFKGGFDTKKKSDMEQLTDLIFKPIKEEKEVPKVIEEPKVVEPVLAIIEDIPKEETKSFVEDVKKVVEETLKPKKTKKKKKTTKK